MYLIYALQDPNTKEIRYIGRSTKGLKRPQNHLLPCYYLAKKNKKALRKTIYFEVING